MDPSLKRGSKMKSSESVKQEIPTHRIEGFPKVYGDQPSLDLVSFCVIQDILNRPNGIANCSIFNVGTLIMVNNAGKDKL